MGKYNKLELIGFVLIVIGAILKVLSLYLLFPFRVELVFIIGLIIYLFGKIKHKK